MPPHEPRQRTVALRPDVYRRLKELAEKERRTMGAQIAVLLDMADAQRRPGQVSP